MEGRGGGFDQVLSAATQGGGSCPSPLENLTGIHQLLAHTDVPCLLWQERLKEGYERGYLVVEAEMWPLSSLLHLLPVFIFLARALMQFVPCKDEEMPNGFHMFCSSQTKDTKS